MHCNFVSTQLSICALKHQFPTMIWEYSIWPDSNTQIKVTRFTYLFSVYLGDRWETYLPRLCSAQDLRQP